MSLYNLVHGRNPIAASLLAMLDLDEARVGRFRDAFIRLGEGGEPEIHVYTRNGGGNRDHWDLDPPREPFAACGCPGCIITYALPQHPLYLGDADDDFDRTYATVRFRVPEAMRAWVADLAKTEDQRTPAERWATFLEKLQTQPDDPDVQRVNRAMAPLLEAIAGKKD